MITEIERALQMPHKIRSFLIGAHAVNPVNGDIVPIFVANYVLLEYGTGRRYGRPCARPEGFPLREGI